ncbi:hypothetical protein [Chryseobacterium sp. EO14]|uniref:hypothetical protein n=1 Tax=Chryseobacterium sp. EO14 TaxID=2950551 RepID=UPI00210A0B83|nr:hypothetical protein [Chryseobacterium sp. EO14]MCQ4139207.1 hypothetical protein [Chryseobacterium sp. EO14]
MKNHIEKEGFINRKENGLPDKKTKMEIIVSGKNGDEVFRCKWTPAEISVNPNKKHEGYLGSAEIMTGKYEGIQFHAWEQNDSEFIYYKI